MPSIVSKLSAISTLSMFSRLNEIIMELQESKKSDAYISCSYYQHLHKWQYKHVKHFLKVKGYLMNRHIMEVEIRSQIVVLSRERIYGHISVGISCASYAMLVSGVKGVDLCSGSVHEQPRHVDPSAISLFDEQACSLSEVTAGLVLRPFPEYHDSLD